MGNQTDSGGVIGVCKMAGLGPSCKVFARNEGMEKHVEPTVLLRVQGLQGLGCSIEAGKRKWMPLEHLG